MKRFIQKILLFLLLIKAFDILLASFFATSIRSIRTLENDYGSLNRMYNGSINADIIFLGSSRTYIHINPQVIQDVTQLTAWNLGMDGSNFDQHKFTLEEYLLHNTVPKLVVFEADLPTLDDGALNFKREYFLPYVNYSTHTRELFASTWEETTYYLFFSSAPYKQQLPVVLSGYREVLSGITSPGEYISEPLSPSDVFTADFEDYFMVNGAQLNKGQISSDMLVRIPFPQPIVDVGFSGMDERMAGFEELSQLAEQQGFTLVLLFPPWPYGAMDESQRQTAVDAYKELSARYENTYFLDYGYEEFLSSELGYWWNEAHLNLEGANIFSQKIGNELVEILQKK